jgi:DNA-directed RNA polymerase specialized sigma24 family protein
MSDPKKKNGPAEDTRSILKRNHKKVYYLCRFFANNYKEHQYLFSSIISAAAQSIRGKSTQKEKQILFLRACLNMAALHSITRSLEQPEQSPENISYKSPDYQKSMLQFREAIAGITDYKKMLLFLHFENMSPDEISDISGLPASNKKTSKQNTKKDFIPYLKEKLIWS